MLEKIHDKTNSWEEQIAYAKTLVAPRKKETPTSETTTSGNTPDEANKA